jgi:hypothetical protein
MDTMKRDEALLLLKSADPEDEPLVLPGSVLKHLSAADIPENVSVEVGEVRDGITYLDFEGCFYGGAGNVQACARLWYVRKYWYEPLSLDHYLDLVQRAAEVRASVNGDIHDLDRDGDDNHMILTFNIDTGTQNLRAALDYAQRVVEEVREAAESASTEVGRLASALAGRISAWGDRDEHTLVNAVETSHSSDERGRALEELLGKLLSAVPGFSVTGRIKTATEEIDLVVLNGSDDPLWRKESQLLIVECKNWSGKCGKNEFVVFHSKIENRKGRCRLGFLVSWNGFAETISKEMLRGSREDILVVPVTGKEIRAAVRDQNFPEVLAAAWQSAVNL